MNKEAENLVLKELVELVFSEEEEIKKQALKKIREVGEEVIDDLLAEELGGIYRLLPLEFLKIYCQFYTSTREHEPVGEKPFVAHIEAVQCMIASGDMDYIHADDELNIMLMKKINKLIREPVNKEEKISIFQQLISLYPTVPKMKDCCVNYDAIEILGNLGEAEVEKVLLYIVLGNDHDIDTKNAALKQLQKIGGERTVDEMIKVLENNEDEFWDIKTETIRTLGAITSSRSKSALEQVYTKIRWCEERQAIKEALNNIEHDYVATKVQETKNKLQPLLNSGDEGSKEKLTQLLKHQDLSVRDYTIIALGNMGDKRAVPYLVNCFNDKDGEVCETVLALAKLVKRHEIGKLLREHPLDIDTVVCVENQSRKMHPFARQFIEEVCRKIEIDSMG